MQQFNEAFNTKDDMEAYNRVQAVERAVGRVQNFVADLAEAGTKLALLPRLAIAERGSVAQQAFEALRDAGVVDLCLCPAGFGALVETGKCHLISPRFARFYACSSRSQLGCRLVCCALGCTEACGDPVAAGVASQARHPSGRFLLAGLGCPPARFLPGVPRLARP